MRKQTHRNDPKARYDMLNRLPAAIRKKTNPDLQALHKDVMKEVEIEAKETTKRNRKEALQLASESDQWIYFEEHYYYSNLNGDTLFTVNAAMNYFAQICEHCKPETAAKVITVFHNNQWKQFSEYIKEVTTNAEEV